MKNSNILGSTVPSISEWTYKTEAEVKEALKSSKNFRSVRALKQTAENTKGEEVFGWIANDNGGYIFIPYDKYDSLPTDKNWFENISEISLVSSED